MTALDWLPDAIRDPHAKAFPWQEAAPTKGCLHTTETDGFPTYAGWTQMPHATIMPTPGRGVTVRQHLPFSQASFALVHAQGTEPTNGAHVFQFELVGTCDRNGPAGAYFWPGADDAVLRDLYRKVVGPLSAAFSIPLVTPAWKAYPASYGENNGVRLSEAAFHAFHGWLGHEHAPGGNVHGDPGLFPWGRLKTLADPPHPSKPVIYGPLHYGDTGSSVRVAQAAAHVTADGIFGRRTLAAVEAFQRAHKLAADGIVGPRTSAAMGARYLTR